MTSTTSAGTTLAICASAPTSFDAAGYGGLAFTTIGGVESISAFGAQSAVNNFQPLAGGLEKHKGPVNFGTIQVPMAIDKADAGQTILGVFAAPGNRAEASFLVTYPDGDRRFFRGRAFGLPETVGAAVNVLMGNAAIEITTKPIPAPPVSAIPAGALLSPLDGSYITDPRPGFEGQYVTLPIGY